MRTIKVNRSVTQARAQKIPKPPSALEESLALQIKIAGLPVPVREFKFHPTRQWRCDFAYPDRKLIIEVEGGAWNGRHTYGAGFLSDLEKYAEATTMGYTVLRVGAPHVKDGRALAWLKSLLGPMTSSCSSCHRVANPRKDAENT